MPAHTPADFAPAVARDLGLPAHGVARAMTLFAEGNTVPFVARYRKEATGGLDEVALRRVGDSSTPRSVEASGCYHLVLI